MMSPLNKAAAAASVNGFSHFESDLYKVKLLPTSTLALVRQNTGTWILLVTSEWTLKITLQASCLNLFLSYLVHDDWKSKASTHSLSGVGEGPFIRKATRQVFSFLSQFIKQCCAFCCVCFPALSCISVGFSFSSS